MEQTVIPDNARDDTGDRGAGKRVTGEMSHRLDSLCRSKDCEEGEQPAAAWIEPGQSKCQPHGCRGMARRKRLDGAADQFLGPCKICRTPGEKRMPDASLQIAFVGTNAGESVLGELGTNPRTKYASSHAQ